MQQRAVLSSCCPNRLSLFRSEAINACATGSQWPLAIRLVALPAPADVIAVAGALSACEHGSYWAGAIHLLQSMPQSRLLADEACNQSVTCQKMLAIERCPTLGSKMDLWDIWLQGTRKDMPNDCLCCSLRLQLPAFQSFIQPWQNVENRIMKRWQLKCVDL